MRASGSVVTALLVLGAAPRLEAQVVEAGDVSLRLTGRIQVQYNTTSVDENDLGSDFDGDVASSTFEARRVRFGARITIDDWVRGEIEPDFSTRGVGLRNAFVELDFTDEFSARIGQFKKPFSLFFLTSDTEILTIERGVRIRGLSDAVEVALGDDVVPGPFIVLEGDLLVPEEQDLLEELRYAGYDLGAELHGEIGRFGYALGIFNGKGADRLDDDDGKAITARTTYQPREDGPLVLGGGLSYSEFGFTRLVDGGAIVSDNGGGMAFEADAEWGEFRRPGVHLQLEGAYGDNIVRDGSFFGMQGVAAYFRPTGGDRVEGLEPLLRVSFANANLERTGDTGLLVTPGFNVYFFGRNRFQLNWDLYFLSGDRFDAENAFVAQAQIAF